MGCWNETCLLSRLPVTCGQEIACVFIAPVDGWPETVYSDNQYVPASLPFFGRYDDYGRIEDVTDDPPALKSLSGAKLYKSEGGDWEPVRLPADSGGITDLSDMARQGELWTENRAYAGGHAQVRLAFFHKDLWDYAVNQRLRQMANDRVAQLRHRWPAAKALDMKDKADRDALKALAAMDSVMNTMRAAWQPTCGTGSQSCVDYPWQVKLYKMFRDRADAFYKSGLE